jgi:hypothetical protein
MKDGPVKQVLYRIVFLVLRSIEGGRRAVCDDDADGISGTIVQALDELHSELRADPT